MSEGTLNNLSKITGNQRMVVRCDGGRKKIWIREVGFWEIGEGGESSRHTHDVYVYICMYSHG